MVYRDPETGQYRSDGNGSGLTYADHEVHHVSHILKWREQADAGPSEVYRDTIDHEITSRGLDPDELAELRAMRVQLTLGTDGPPTPQDEAGSVVASMETGYNLSGDEFVFENRSSTGVDSDASGTNDWLSVTNDTDEVGQLTADRLSWYPGFSDTTDGTSGAGGAPTLEYMLPLAGVLGSGPFVDSADDFVTSIKMNVNNLVQDSTAEINCTLYYRVEEMEGGRTRFGR